MPKYLVKLPDELTWIAFLGSITGVWLAVGEALDFDQKIVAAIAAFIPICGRLLFGMVMPTPTPAQEIKDVIDHTDAKPSTSGETSI